MPRALWIVLSAAGALLALAVALFALAFILIPRDWIEREAQRQASRVSGASVTWERLEPGISGLTLGVRIRGLSLRVPAEGDERLKAGIREVFVQFRLLPLLARRVEIAAARVRGGGIAVTDRGDALGRGGAGDQAVGPVGVAFVLPRLEIEEVDFRTRDPLGGGFDFRRVKGSASIDGPLGSLRAIRAEVFAESLFWKPSAAEPLVALPAPLDVTLALAARDGGKRLEVTEGKALLGPFVSGVKGEVRLPDGPGPPALALSISGPPQTVRSTDPAIRPISAPSPATWSATASWDIRVEGPAGAPNQSGRLVLKPLSVTASSNTFAMEQASATWTTRPDRTFTARGEGYGGGVTFTMEAHGSSARGGVTQGKLFLRAPAQRLNGLVPDAPTWDTGEVECRATFKLQPPAAPDVRWTITGRGLSGTVPGVARPVRRLGFDVEGSSAVVTVRAFDVVVGSTTAAITGRVLAGKPLGTGSFKASIDRLVAEEWSPPSPPGSSLSGAGGERRAASSLPIPLRAFDAAVAIGEVKSGGMIVRDVTVPVKFVDGRLAAEPIRGAIGTGTIAGALDVTNVGSSKPAFTLHLDLKRAPVQEVVSGLLPVKLGLTGLVSGVVDLSGPGLPGPAVSDSLRGNLSGTVEQGALQQGPALQSLRNSLGLEAAPEISFKTLTHSLRIAGGRMILDKVRGETGGDVFEMAGSFGFDQSLDVGLRLRLAPGRIKAGSALAELARYARDADGRIPVDVKITGSARSPRVSIQPGRLLEGAGTALKRELVKGLTAPSAPSSKSPPDSATTARDSLRRDAIDQGREALKRLLGK
jgi:hypothetical protein